MLQRQHVLKLDRQNMNEMINSELTMVTNKAFNYVLQSVQNSGLNYHIKMSPFSAFISVKKSVIKNKDGMPIMPILPDSDDVKTGLEMELILLKQKYEELLHKHESALETIKILKNYEIAHDQTLNNVLVAHKAPDDSPTILNNTVEEKKVTFELEENFTKKVVKIPSQHDAFECSNQPLVSQPSGTNQTSSSVLCSICSTAIPNYSTLYFYGYKLRPACNTCTKKDHDPPPLSAFPSCEMPSSLVSHWISPHHGLSISPSISSSISIQSHCVKWPCPGEVLYTVDDMLRELMEKMKKSKWWK